uniref:Cystatin domain-containing protein n=1 Tax=Oryzias latipes TaxID=8090 RepID=A0A3B3HGZ5_ORYLA
MKLRSEIFFLCFCFTMFVLFFVFAFVTCCSKSVKLVKIGEPQKVPVSSANVSTTARFAIARMQIVVGINYILDAQLGRTVCKRKDTVDCQLCALQTDPKAGPKCSCKPRLNIFTIIE